MAAYAALVSLMNILDQIKIHPRFSSSIDKYQIESLGEKIDFFLDFVENYHSHGGTTIEKAEDLESQIASAAHEAEDVIESHIVDQILPESTEINLDVQLQRRYLFGLQKVILDMDSIKNEVLKAKQQRGFDDQKPTYSVPAASSTSHTTGKSSMVGFDDELMQLTDVLTRQESSRQIISIVGMCGTGKTTLARNVYEHSIIVHHFDLLAWATISQEYNVREILLQLLSSTDGTVDELGERLHKRLFGRRHLIILDDMWSSDVLDRIKYFFPDNGNGSRIVLTSRLSNVATHFHSFCIRVNFLDEHKSWHLFCQEVFGQENCPQELVGIGKKIVEHCKGLPLSIVVIGGLLRKSYKTKEYWWNVATHINSILYSGENDQCLNVLYLSYSHLPAHLKPCFLYMGTFREDYEIRFSGLIKLWVAEGFLKPNGVQILEEIAEDYLKDLTDRNLILVSAHGSNGKIRSCRIHDLLRELCLRIGNKEKFFCVVKGHGVRQDIDREHRLIFHGNVHGRSASLARSLLGSNPMVPIPKCRLLRVLGKPLNLSVEFQILNVNLRYCEVLCYGCMLPSSISLIWHLETLVITGANHGIVAPSEIWRMPQLRHLNCSRILLPDPPPSDQDDDSVVSGNLQTLKVVVNFRLSGEVCKRIPNIKKLCMINEDLSCDTLQNLHHLHKLESLSICCFTTEPILINELKDAFPCSLNKLSLNGCSIRWEDLSMVIGSLPRLEVLKLKESFTEDFEWNCVEGGFLHLKFLRIEFCGLKSWNLDCASFFPALEKLVLIDLWELNEVPSGIGHIPTLQLIRMEDCTQSAAISAIRIKDEQESYGNDGIRIQVQMHHEKAERLKEKVNSEGLSINNIELLDSWTSNFSRPYVRIPSHLKAQACREGLRILGEALLIRQMQRCA